MNDWNKDENFWIHSKSSNAGDVQYNTMSRIIDMEDQSDWAHDSLDECIELLSQRKRWPERMNQENTAKNWIQWKWSKWGLGKKIYSRPRGAMTRDPYVAVITCALHLGRPEEIQNIKIPWYCYSRETWKWKRELERDNLPFWRQRVRYYRALSKTLKYGNNPNIIANKKEAGLL